ncbi:DNA primase [Candidatus Woesearchaeota archaeon]|nr:DNA primase [Candidatus Woesearchaeota archaeon]
MAKISPVAAKYIIHSTITIDGVVDRPDVIGAIFGQTEGLLGNDLELRELQRSGRIGRIEVNMNTTSGKTKGEIIIPSSLDKTETAIVAAALEIIQRIGPCNAKIEVGKIEDVRTSKRQFVIERAKELLRELTDSTLPDSQEISDEVAQSVRMMEVGEYGKDRLACGPAIEESDEIIIVEGRADVLNLLKHGFKNAIAMNGSSCPPTIRELCSRKTVTAFVDGDRGGDLNVRELLSVAEIDFVCKAPDGKEVEELTKKEIHKGLRSRITAEQAKLDLGIDNDGGLKVEEVTLRQQHFTRQPKPQQQGGMPPRRPENGQRDGPRDRNDSGRERNDNGREHRESQPAPRFSTQQRGPPTPRVQPQDVPREESSPRPSVEEKKKLKETMEDLFGTRGACIFDQKLNILGKVPLSEVSTTIKSLNGGVYALAVDGAIDLDLVKVAEKVGVAVLVGTGNKVKESSKVAILTDDQL